MYIALLGLVLGVAIGALYPITIPLIYARYTAVGIIGLFDSVIGALRANLQKQYDTSIFLSGVLINMLFAMALTFLGDKLSLDLYLAVVFVFVFRIFRNIAQMRYSLLPEYLGKRRVKEELHKD